MRMQKLIPEDYSVDLRTILAKERTILAHQNVQLAKIGISIGVFASALAIVKFLISDAHWGLVIAIILMGVSAAVGIRAYIRYYLLQIDLNKVVEVEQRMAHAHRLTLFEEPGRKLKKK